MAKNGFREVLHRNFRYFIVGGLFIILVVLLIVFMVKNKGKKDNEDDNSSTIPELETSVEVPKDKYEENAYPAVNALVQAYLDAMSIGDVDTMSSVSSSMSEDLKAFYQAQAQYIGNYSNYNVYTKKGPQDNSYFLLATFDLLVNGQSTPLPALVSLYVCTNDSGALYINSGNLTSDEEAYILELIAQKDFSELIDQVELDYNKILEDNEELANTVNSFKDQINRDAQGILAQKQQDDLQAAADAEAQAQAEALAANATQVRCTGDNVNIRASASTDAESLGKTKAGDVYTRYEEMENGWSKIDYNGQEAYIKSEFLESMEPAAEAGAADAGAQPGGMITVTENVNVRKTPSETGEKIATAHSGEQYELIENSNGWCKINYKGQEAYVKADYVR